MIGRTTLGLILLISCAHALVHVYEISLPSVEQQIAGEYYGSDLDSGKQLTGLLSNAWRLMWGLGAVAAGWLVDRWGSRRMLILYLTGCSAACAAAASAHSRDALFGSMIFMGLLASIYHPAGLALISHETTVANRARALGIHGIFGSAGIGLTPLGIGLLLSADMSWRGVYWLLLPPGLVLAAVFWSQVRGPGEQRTSAIRGDNPADAEDQPAWAAFVVLTVLAASQGFIYSALMAFLPRYLSRYESDLAWADDENMGNYLASAVLLLGCVGQDFAGRWARHERLERQLTLVTFSNAPLLAWMAVASGWGRAASAGLLALVHFMHQPLYNTLIAKYTPRHRRSLCYGISFAMGLGLGSFGAGFAGLSRSDLVVYGSLAGVAGLGGSIGVLLCLLERQRRMAPSPNGASREDH